MEHKGFSEREREMFSFHSLKFTAVSGTQHWKWVSSPESQTCEHCTVTRPLMGEKILWTSAPLLSARQINYTFTLGQFYLSRFLWAFLFPNSNLSAFHLYALCNYSILNIKWVQFWPLEILALTPSILPPRKSDLPLEFFANFQHCQDVLCPCLQPP